MKKDLNDQDIDRLMQSIVCDTAREDELRDIAESPTVWWAVQREIANGEATKSPWPPANVIRRWLMILVPTAAAAAILISLFVWLPRSSNSTDTVAHVETPALDVPQTVTPTDERKDDNTHVVETKTTTKQVIAKPAVRQRAANSTLIAKSQPAKAPATSSEIKTDFIALTYARNPSSGQIVRVKVPRSMMVQVGLVASVSKPQDLVDAEVLVGDDGLTRAIRFIH